MSFNKTYFDYQKKYSEIYGSKTIVFIQKGTFYESYSTKELGQNLEIISDIIKTTLTRSDGKKGGEPSIGNPYMLGFPVIKAAKNLNYLTQAGYTAVLFDEIATFNEDHKKIIERKISGIYSPGTFVADDRPIHSSNYLLCAYIAEEPQLKGAPSLHAIGITLIDIVTARSIIHEFYSSQLDTNFGLDELFRFMQIFKPTEVVIYYHPVKMDPKTISSIKSYLELDSIPQSYFCVYYKEKDEGSLNLLTEKSFKINYQNTYLTKIYNLEEQINFNKKSALQVMNLERKQYATTSLIILLRFLTTHNVNLLTNLNIPEVYIYNEHLILGNNAIDQLNVISNQASENKISSLFDVVNKTTTIMGKRFLKYTLANPYSKENADKINERYELISQIISDQLALALIAEMKNIHDIERMHRKMALGTIYPAEFSRLDKSYQHIIKLITSIGKNESLKKLITRSTATAFCKFQAKYNEIFIMDELAKYSNTNYSDIGISFFQPGVNEVLDSIQNKVKSTACIVNSIEAHFKKIILSQIKKPPLKDNIITTKHGDDGSYYFSITKTKEKILKKYLESEDYIMIDMLNDRMKLSTADIEFCPLKKGNTKIFIPSIDEQTMKLHDRKEKMTKLMKNLFSENMMELYSENMVMLHQISKFVSELDFLVSGAQVADQYYYCRPKLLDYKESYLDAKQLRHPIIERLCEGTEYIPNDVEIGARDNKNGVLLYSQNFGGKSSLMKSIGLSIILAQIGYYVPAKKFSYSPYMAIYARINANDNLFKNLSSFILEMTELDAILKRIEVNGANTMVIGDEVCRGTEVISATAIVASTLVQLSEKNTTFVFASHLHELIEIDEIKALKNLRLFHLNVIIDKENDNLIFERKLVPGTGPSIYGVMVAKFMIKNPKFINNAEIIKNRLLKSDIAEFPEKESNYNSKLLMTKCAICEYRPTEDYHKELETHHINMQKDCHKDGKIIDKPYLSKNGLYNLVTLCRQCHVKVHKNQIKIDKYQDTSKGPKLVYKKASDKSVH